MRRRFISPETLRISAPPTGLDHTAGGCSFISLSLLYKNTHVFILSTSLHPSLANLLPKHLHISHIASSHTAGALSLPLIPMELPRSRLYYFTVEEMNFTVTETLRASRVEKWIRAIKQRFLDATPIKCVGLDCEFTSPHEDRQRAAILQLSVASEVLDLPDMLGQSRAAAAQGILEGHHHQILRCGYHQ
jgi:hypothetical protein